MTYLYGLYSFWRMKAMMQDRKLRVFRNYSAISNFFRPHPPLRGTLAIGRAVGSLTLTVQPYPPGSLPVEPGGATSPAATRHPLPMGEGYGFADAHRCAR